MMNELNLVDTEIEEEDEKNEEEEEEEEDESDFSSPTACNESTRGVQN